MTLQEVSKCKLPFLLNVMKIILVFSILIVNGNIFQFLPSQSLSEQVKFDDWLKYIIFLLLQCTKQTIDILPRYFIIFLASLANVHYKYVLTWASGVSQSITCFNVMYHHPPIILYTESLNIWSEIWHNRISTEME